MQGVGCSINQQQMLAVSMGSAGLAYNQLSVYCLRSKQAVDQSALTAALNFLIARHESLRTSFATTAAGATQRVHAPDVCSAEVCYRLAPQGVQQAQSGIPGWVEAAINKDMLTPFQLDEAPLFRATLYEVRSCQQLISAIYHVTSIHGLVRVIARQSLVLEVDMAFPAQKQDHN